MFDKRRCKSGHIFSVAKNLQHVNIPCPYCQEETEHIQNSMEETDDDNIGLGNLSALATITSDLSQNETPPDFSGGGGDSAGAGASDSFSTDSSGDTSIS